MIRMTQPRQARPQRRPRGFTLVETLVGLGVFALLLLGVMGMFITMLRLCASVTGASSASLDAANAIQRVTLNLREARSFLLPGDPADTLDSAANYTSATGSVTGIRVTFPKDFPQITVSTGASTPSLPGGSNPALYDIKNDGPTLLFFRANWQQPDGADGTPNPDNGRALWISGTENGQSGLSEPVVKSIAPGGNSVQFIQPHMLNNGPAIPNEIQVKITCSVYDPIHGQTSSETASGTVTSLTGECTYLRDHNPAGVSSGGAHGQSQLH